MGAISIILLVIFVISALLLILLVMLQDEGSEGMGGIFGGGGSSQIGNRSGNILTKTTSILGAVFILSAFGLAWFSRTPDSGDIEQAAARLRGGSGSGTQRTFAWSGEKSRTASACSRCVSRGVPSDPTRPQSWSR